MHFLSWFLPRADSFPGNMSSFSQKELTAEELRLDKLNYPRKWVSEWIMWWALKQNAYISIFMYPVWGFNYSYNVETHLTERRWNLGENFLIWPIHWPLSNFDICSILIHFLHLLASSLLLLTFKKRCIVIVVPQNNFPEHVGISRTYPEAWEEGEELQTVIENDEFVIPVSTP